jgi:signal peptidase I
LGEQARRDRSNRRRAREWTTTFLIALGLFLIVRTFLVEAFRIPTGSMENTLLVGDFLLVNKAVHGARVPFVGARTPAFAEPARGEIVVFTPPHDPGRNYVKRIIGVPGDTLAMVDNVLFLSGAPQRAPRIRRQDPADSHSSSGMIPAVRGTHPLQDGNLWGDVAVEA